MKFNPYAALLMTGASMFLTVVMSETGTNAALVKAGAVSVDRDMSSFAAKTLSALQSPQTPASLQSEAALQRPSLPNLQVVSDPGRGATTIEPQTRLAAVVEPAPVRRSTY